MSGSVYPAPSGGGGVSGKKQQVFTASGTFTAPTASSYNGYIEVTVVGGGAGGDNNNYYYGGGGGASVKTRVIQATAGVGYTVTIGAGGAVATNGNASSIAAVSTVSAAGGITGTIWPNYNVGGASAGEGSGGGSFGSTSGNSARQSAGTATGLPFGGGGGSYVYYTQGQATSGGGQAGQPGYANTGGGGGATQAGGSGIVIITWWE